MINLPISRGRLVSLLECCLDNERLEHSLKTERQAIILARQHGADVCRSGFAALAHDLFKCWPKTRQLGYLRRNLAGFSGAWLENPQIWHGPAAAIYLHRRLGVWDREILGAVFFHTTARPGMSEIEKIVFLADKIEPTRNYDGVEDLRIAAAQNLDRAMHLSLGRVVKSGIPLAKQTVFAYNEFAEKMGGDV